VIPSGLGLSELALSVLDGVFITCSRTSESFYSTRGYPHAGIRLVIFRTKDRDKGLLRDIHAAEQYVTGDCDGI